MKRWRFLILFGILAVIFVLAYPFLFQDNEALPHLPKISEGASPQQILQSILKLNIEETFQPQSYRSSLENSDLARLGFGKNFDNYKLDWQRGNTYFLTFVGYDKEQDESFIGYTINIYTTEINTSGKHLAKIFLRNVPSYDWRISPTKIQPGFTSTISTIVWQEQKNKLFLEILSLNYGEPQSGFIPNITVKDITIIRLLLYTPNNPEYKNVEEFERAAHSLYGEQ